MIRYIGTVKWNGNHYFQGQLVYGSKMRIENGVCEIFDDEEYLLFGHTLCNNCWVEVFENSVIDTLKGEQND